MPVRLIPGHPLGVDGGLVGLWTLGGNCWDSTNNNPTAPGATAPSFAGSPFGPVLSCTSGYTTSPDSPKLALTGTLTLAAKVNSNFANYRGIISKSNGTVAGPFSLNVGNNSLPYVSLGNGSSYLDVVSTISVTAGVWTDLIAVISAGSSGSVQFYINGTLRGTYSFSGATRANGAYPLLLGALDSSYPLGGLLSRPVIYNTMLNADACAQLASEPFCMLEPSERQVLYYFQGNTLLGLATLGSFSSRGAAAGKNAVGALGTFGPASAAGIAQAKNPTVGLGTLGPVGARGAASGKNAIFGDATFGPLSSRGIVRPAGVPSRIRSLQRDVRQRSLPVDN